MMRHFIPKVTLQSTFIALFSPVYSKRIIHKHYYSFKRFHSRPFKQTQKLKPHLERSTH